MAKQVRKRKDRSDSVAFQTDIMRQVAGIDPPAGCYKLTKEERYFWDRIIAARADWTSIDLLHAVNLAETLADIRAHRRALKKERKFIRRASGSMMANPRIAIIRDLTMLSVQLSVKLQIHASATIGRPRDQVARNTAHRRALEAMQNMDDDEARLIPRPLPAGDKPH